MVVYMRECILLDDLPFSSVMDAEMHGESTKRQRRTEKRKSVSLGQEKREERL